MKAEEFYQHCLNLPQGPGRARALIALGDMSNVKIVSNRWRDATGENGCVMLTLAAMFAGKTVAETLDGNGSVAQILGWPENRVQGAITLWDTMKEGRRKKFRERFAPLLPELRQQLEAIAENQPEDTAWPDELLEVQAPLPAACLSAKQHLHNAGVVLLRVLLVMSVPLAYKLIAG